MAMTAIYSILLLSRIGSMPEVIYRVNVVRHPQDEFLPVMTYNIAAINGYSVSSLLCYWEPGLFPSDCYKALRLETSS